MAWIKQDEKKLAEAVDACLKAIEAATTDSARAGTNIALANTYFEMRQYDLAVEAARRGLGFAAKEPVVAGGAHFLLGRVYYQRQEYRQAAAEFERAKALDPKEKAYDEWLQAARRGA
jgi:tetratricopeptide (TPR) repeat protein